jgi:hypothetical protein
MIQDFTGQVGFGQDERPPGVEILIKLENRPEGADALTSWDRGRLVAVRPIGHQWGALECLPKFCILTIDNITVEQANGYILLGASNIMKWKFDLDDVSFPPAIKNELEATGRSNVSHQSVISFIKRTQ